MSTSILLADDHHLVRQGLRVLLAAEPDFHLVGEAADAREVVDLAERLRPDVLVLDLLMPGINGLSALRQVVKCAPKTRVIILSMCSSEAYVSEALQDGAAGYVLKSSRADELILAVREVVAGRCFLSPPLSEKVLAGYMKSRNGAALDPYDTLTTREREVLYLAARGLSNAETAEKLFVSRRTVETHRANLMRKLNFRSHTDLIRYALRRGLLPAEE